MAALVTLSAVAGIIRLRIDISFGVFMPSKSPYLVAARRMNDAFGDSGQLIALVQIGEDQAKLDSFPEIASELARIDGVHAAESPIPESVLGLEGEARISAIEQMKTVSAGGGLVSSDGTDYAVFRLRLTESAQYGQLMRQVRKVFKDRHLAYSAGNSTSSETARAWQPEKQRPNFAIPFENERIALNRRRNRHSRCMYSRHASHAFQFLHDRCI